MTRLVSSTSEHAAGSRIAGARLLMQPFVAGLLFFVNHIIPRLSWLHTAPLKSSSLKST